MDLENDKNSATENIRPDEKSRLRERLKITDSNFRGVFVLLVCILALLIFRQANSQATLTDDITVINSDLAAAGEKINPNTASWASLSRLPAVGPVRAKSICLYRDEFLKNSPHTQAFNCPGDLAMVSGIGTVTVDKISAWLSFDAAQEPERHN